MRVFLVWSGTQSRMVALKLHSWLSDVIQALDPWMSQHDVPAGSQWSNELSRNLSESRFGIVCLTRANQLAPYIHFEAGAIAKATDDTARVVPYLIDLDPSELVRESPLNSFQWKQAVKSDTWDILTEINGAMGDRRLAEAKLASQFELRWPELERVIADAKAAVPPESQAAPDLPQMVADVLVEVRNISRQVAGGVQPVRGWPPGWDDLPPLQGETERVFSMLRKHYGKTGIRLGVRASPDGMRLEGRLPSENVARDMGPLEAYMTTTHNGQSTRRPLGESLDMVMTMIERVFGEAAFGIDRGPESLPPRSPTSGDQS